MQTSLFIKTLSAIFLASSFLACSEFAQADSSRGKTGKHVRFVSFDKVNLEGGYLFANDVLTVHSKTEFEYGGYFRPAPRIEAVSIVDVQNPKENSVMGTIVVEVDPSKTNPEPTELDLARLVPNTVYRIETRVLGPETVPMVDVETYFSYYGPKKNATPPIHFTIENAFGKEWYGEAVEQLNQRMATYRILCAKFADECKSSVGFHIQLWGGGLQYKHNRPHTEVYVEQYTVRMIEQEKQKADEKGRDLPLPLKRELLSAYEGILKKHRTYDPLTAATDRAYLEKIKREARLLRLDIEDSKKQGSAL